MQIDRLSRPPAQALVIGAGVGGLTAASVLASAFERVIILEKDAVSAHEQARPGVTQGQHLHSLLLGGLQRLEALYPGITDTLKARGAVSIRAGLEQQIHESGHWLPSQAVGLEIVSQSRPLLEQVIRERCLQATNIVLWPQVRVRNIDIDADDCVSGLSYEDHAGRAQSLHSALVVDASGRSGHFVRQLGRRYPQMRQQDSIRSNIAYASALLQKPPQYYGRRESLLVIPDPEVAAGGALIDIEQERWLVTLHGRNGLTPGQRLAEWKQFARDKLPTQRLYRRLEQAQLLGEIHRFAKPRSFLRRFDRCSHLPQGYFPLGDTIASVNPIFGQGMTLAIGHAVALQQALAHSACAQTQQRHYLDTAVRWSLKAWRRSLAYDSLFDHSDARQQANLSVLRALAQKKRQQASANPAQFKQLIEQGQMLR